MKYAGLVLLLLSGLLVAPASASAEGDASFTGTCSLIGETRFEPGIALQPQEIAVTADVPGHCTGTLTTASGDQLQLRQEPLRSEVSGSGSHSCLGGTSTGTGYLEIAGERIDYTWELTQLTAWTLAVIRGVGGGAASGVVVPDGSPGNLAMVRGCLQPTAYSVLTGRLDLVTASALVG